ncbi:MAG: SurA N-terminal domain-containing protein [Desulfatiglans sp.]|nr:SurA N-terminal domain-containing protein [Desulfatiglans sp.]
MVLSLMRKHAKSWLIKFFIAIIALVFIFYFGYSFTAREGLKVAFVNGEVITGQEYRKAYNDLREGLYRQYKSVWNDSLIKVFKLRSRALDNLIDQKLISQEARRLGLNVTEDEIQKAIMDHPAFKVDGKFVLARYRSLLSHNRMEPEAFEAGIARELLERKVEQLLYVFTRSTAQEVLEYYTFLNEKVDLSYVQFKPDEFKKGVDPEQTSMKGFFEEHKEDYRVPEKIKVSYITLDPVRFRDQIGVSDSDIEKYYGYNIDTFVQPKQIRARHILFKLKEDATEEDEKGVRERAQSVLEKAVKGSDFAGLAKKYSEGPTKAKGGDLGFFGSGQMAKPFEEAVFNLEKGGISDLVRTRFGYHIIKVEEIKEERTRPLDEVRDEIFKTLADSSSADLAHEKGLSLIDQMPYELDLAQYGEEQGFKSEETDFFAVDDPMPGLGGDKKLRQSLFSIEKGGTSELIKLKDKFYIFQVIEKMPSHLPTIEEVSGRVRNDVIAYLAAREAKSAAEAYLSELHRGKGWDELARERGKKPEKTGLFTRNSSIPKIGYERDLQEIVFSLNENKPYPDKVFENSKGSFVIRWEEKGEIEKKQFEDEKEQYGFSLMQTKHRHSFEKWLNHLREKAEIKIVSPVT